VLDELALHERLGATSEPWALVRQFVRLATLDLQIAVTERLLFTPTRGAVLDSLTTLVARPAFEQAIAKELDRAQRRHHPIALILFDVDHLSSINAELGYGSGDRLLERLGIAARRFFRNDDWWGATVRIRLRRCSQRPRSTMRRRWRTGSGAWCISAWCSSSQDGRARGGHPQRGRRRDGTPAVSPRSADPHGRSRSRAVSSETERSQPDGASRPPAALGHAARCCQLARLLADRGAAGLSAWASSRQPSADATTTSIARRSSGTAAGGCRRSDGFRVLGQVHVPQRAEELRASAQPRAESVDAGPDVRDETRVLRAPYCRNNW